MTFIKTLILSLLLLQTPLLRASQEKVLSEEDRLFLIGKVWGFLKYYHPLVARGAFDWDSKLETYLSNTSKLDTYEQFSGYTHRWISNLGHLPPCNRCAHNPEHVLFLKNFDLSWTQSHLLSVELRKTLKMVEERRFQGEHHYIGRGSSGHFEPKNESTLYNFNWKVPQQRLLVLFRYWNYIEYFFPYKYQTETPWDDVLRKMVTRFLEADTEQAFYMAVQELVASTDDSHAFFTSPLVTEALFSNYLPAKLEVVDDKMVVTQLLDVSKATKDDFQLGDILLTVDDEEAMNVMKRRHRYLNGSNVPAKNRNTISLFMGLEGGANLRFNRGKEVIERYQPFYAYSELSLEKAKPEKWKISKDSVVSIMQKFDSAQQTLVTFDSVRHYSVGYVHMGALQKSDVDDVMTHMMNTDAIIFDMRHYPKGTYQSLSSYLNTSDTTFTHFLQPYQSYPGKFQWLGSKECGKSNEVSYTGEVILLVNENTQGHAEFSCMCLQTGPNVTTIGSQTAGAAGNVSKFVLLKNFYTAMSGLGIFYPDHTETQRVGIRIDVQSKATITGIREGRDEVLEKAMEVARDLLTLAPK